jgi:hypothetical protein
MATTPIISDTQNLMSATLHSQSTSDSIQTMIDSTTSVVSQPNTHSSPLFYGIVGAGAAVIIMILFYLICIYVMLGSRRECRCKCRALKYITPVLIIHSYLLCYTSWYQVDLELGLPTKVNWQLLYTFDNFSFDERHRIIIKGLPAAIVALMRSFPFYRSTSSLWRHRTPRHETTKLKWGCSITKSR